MRGRYRPHACLRHHTALGLAYTLYWREPYQTLSLGSGMGAREIPKRTLQTKRNAKRRSLFNFDGILRQECRRFGAGL